MNVDTKASQSCRACGHNKLFTLVNLGMSPFSNSYIKRINLNKSEIFYPLHAVVCEKCFLVQIDEFLKPDRIFSDYVYFSSYSNTWLEHCKSYVSMVISRFNLSTNSNVVEIASNDGYLLQYFIEKKIPCLGVEPAENIADIAIKKGIPTKKAFFGAAFAKELAKKNGNANLILANNVLAHVPDINDFVLGLKLLLSQDGVVTIEFPHLLKLIQENQFDTIYHEHFSYLSLYCVEKIFFNYGLKIFDIDEICTHGGSLRIYATHIDSSLHSISSSVIKIRETEDKAFFNKISGYLGFEAKVNKVKRDLLTFLNKVKQDGKSVVGYGAAAKGNTLLNYCGIRSDYLDYIVDLSPHKQGLYMPGSHLPIYGPEKIAITKPDYVLILPWNISSEIISQNSHIQSWGGKFVVAIPELKIL
jgi:hypothetical protein